MISAGEVRSPLCLNGANDAQNKKILCSLCQLLRFLGSALRVLPKEKGWWLFEPQFRL